jgi:hypothetical protein
MTRYGNWHLIEEFTVEHRLSMWHRNRQYPFCCGASSNETASPGKRKSAMDCGAARRDNFDQTLREVRY